VRYCGVDVSAKPGGQQLVTLHERRGAEGDVELVATFYEPGTPEAVARTVEGFGRGQAVVAVDAPSGPRLDLLAAGTPLRRALGLPDGRYERMRVCDALLFRRGLPLYPVPPAGQTPQGWEEWIGVGFAVFAALAALGLYRPERGAGHSAPVGSAALRFGRLCETYPDAIFCALLGHRPSPKRTPWGLQQRIAALKVKGIEDADGGLWHRTLDELDACAAAYAAYALAAGLGLWVGAPEEGVIVRGLTRLAGGDREPLAMLARRRGAAASDSSRATSGYPGQTRAMVISHASESATVIEVRASDRPGLLHDVGITLSRASLSVRSAHIATYAGQALDTFYVTEFGGRPLPPARVAQAVSMIIATCDGE
jgi:hypothetical protein